MFIRFLTTKLLAGWKEGKLHLTRWGKGKAHNCPEQNACREGQPLWGWVQIFSTSGKLLTFDPQRWPAESRWWMSRACHSQCMLRALALLAFGSVGIWIGPGEQDMEQLMMYQTVVPTAGPSHAQEPKREIPYDCFLFFLLSEVIFRLLQSLMIVWVFIEFVTILLLFYVFVSLAKRHVGS